MASQSSTLQPSLAGSSVVTRVPPSQNDQNDHENARKKLLTDVKALKEVVKLKNYRLRRFRCLLNQQDEAVQTIDTRLIHEYKKNKSLDMVLPTFENTRLLRLFDDTRLYVIYVNIIGQERVKLDLCVRWLPDTVEIITYKLVPSIEKFTAFKNKKVKTSNFNKFLNDVQQLCYAYHLRLKQMTDFKKHFHYYICNTVYTTDLSAQTIELRTVNLTTNERAKVVIELKYLLNNQRPKTVSVNVPGLPPENIAKLTNNLTDFMAIYDLFKAIDKTFRLTTDLQLYSYMEKMPMLTYDFDFFETDENGNREGKKSVKKHAKRRRSDSDDDTDDSENRALISNSKTPNSLANLAKKLKSNKTKSNKSNVQTSTLKNYFERTRQDNILSNVSNNRSHRNPVQNNESSSRTGQMKTRSAMRHSREGSSQTSVMRSLGLEKTPSNLAINKSNKKMPQKSTNVKKTKPKNSSHDTESHKRSTSLPKPSSKNVQIAQASTSRTGEDKLRPTKHKHVSNKRKK